MTSFEIPAEATQILLPLLRWLLFSIGLWCLLPKFRWKYRWMAWVPGLRMFALGSVLDMDLDGLICGLVDIVVLVSQFWAPQTSNENVEMILLLLQVILFVMLLVYEIRIYQRLTRAMGARKGWIILWILASWLPMLVFGLSRRRMPTSDFLDEAEPKLTGKPGEPYAGQEVLVQEAEAANGRGLEILLRKRTVQDFLKRRYLLRDIALTIPPASLVLLLGGSGSGKTTFVNAITGYEKADATIILNGHDVYREYENMKYRIGFVPQQNLIRGNDTVQHTVGDAAKLRLPTSMRFKERMNRVDEVMNLLGLTAGQEGLVSKKSGGQLRRISIAQELVSGPELFILDEPDSGLDGVIAREIFEKLREIANEGRIVIAITHTPDRVVDLFDYVIVLARDSKRVGRLAFFGTPREAREFFGKDTMEGIVMSVNRKDEGGDGLADEFIARYQQRVASGHEESKTPAPAIALKEGADA